MASSGSADLAAPIVCVIRIDLGERDERVLAAGPLPAAQSCTPSSEKQESSRKHEQDIPVVLSSRGLGRRLGRRLDRWR